MPSQVRQFNVMWQGELATCSPPSREWVERRLYDGYLGNWSVTSAVPYLPAHGAGDECLACFVTECLRHIPAQFAEDMGGQQTVIRYLASVQDLMSLLKEHVR